MAHPDPEVRTDVEWMREIGRRLRALRESRELSLVQVAERSGLNRQTVSRAEGGDNPTLLTLIRLLRVYGRVRAVEDLVPEPLPSPLEAVERMQRGRE